MYDANALFIYNDNYVENLIDLSLVPWQNVCVTLDSDQLVTSRFDVDYLCPICKYVV